MTLSGPDSPLPPTASVGTITVSTTRECAWTAAADANWVARLDPSSGQGGGTVQVAVAANPSSVARQTDVVINGSRARIQQEPAPCVYGLSASSATVDARGDAYQVTVSTSAGCVWTASSTTTWISIAAGSSGSGSGVVEFTVQANGGSARTGSITIAGQSFTLTQNGAGASGGGGSTTAPACTYVLSSLALTVPAAGGGGSLLLTTTCAWSATPSATWITIQSPTSGSGNATVVFSVAANSGAARRGTITIGNAVVSISQEASANCAFTVNPSTVSAPAGGSTGMSIAVATTASCGWTATSTATWITITAGASVTGSGNVTFNVAPNSGGSRTGAIDVAGKTITVTQAGTVTAPCSFAVNPLTVPVASTATAGQSLSVTTTTGCTWTAASNASWITVTAGAAGSGSGTVKFDVGANTGAARNGTLTVAGQTVTVSQASGCVYAVALVPTSFRDEGGTGLGTVTTATGCTWTTSSDSSWIVVQSGAAGSGPGTVTLQIQANPGAPRTGTVTIAGQSFDIKQSNK